MLVAALAALLAAGCGGDGTAAAPTAAGPSGPSSKTPTSSPSATTGVSTSPTSAPRATASVSVPAAARANTPEGAEAFARFYYQEAGRAYVTTETSGIEALSLAECTGCGAMIRAVRQMQQAGEHFEEPSLQIKLVRTPIQVDGLTRVEVAGTEKAVRVLDSSGKVVRSTSRGVFTFRTDLAWRAGTWRVQRLTVL